MMNTTKRIYTALLATSIASALALGSASVFAQEDDSKLKTYTDPVSGELKVAPKLLSEMTEEEKALLTDDERAYLKEVEAQVTKDAEENK
jgi:hypothetical protein